MPSEAWPDAAEQGRRCQQDVCGAGSAESGGAHTPKERKTDCQAILAQAESLHVQEALDLSDSPRESASVAESIVYSSWARSETCRLWFC